MLGKALGEGTFGKVKLGTHILTGEKVSLHRDTLDLNFNLSYFIGGRQSSREIKDQRQKGR
jgi:hypothetical protein